MSGKKWITPKLVILYRGRPEEAVLQACKYSAASTGPGNWNNRCQQWLGGDRCSELSQT